MEVTESRVGWKRHLDSDIWTVSSTSKDWMTFKTADPACVVHFEQTSTVCYRDRNWPFKFQSVGPVSISLLSVRQVVGSISIFVKGNW